MGLPCLRGVPRSWGTVPGWGVQPPHPDISCLSQVEVVFWLLSMLATRDQEDTARTLLAMSSSPESCVAMRRSGCLPLLLQILHGTEAGAGGRNGTPGAPGAKDARMRANAALHNIVFSQPDQGLARKEMRVLHVLEQIRAYCETCWDWLQARDGGPEGSGTGAGECASWAPRGAGQHPGVSGASGFSWAPALCLALAEVSWEPGKIDWRRDNHEQPRPRDRCSRNHGL